MVAGADSNFRGSSDNDRTTLYVTAGTSVYKVRVNATGLAPSPAQKP
jgi:hypothetical protein